MRNGCEKNALGCEGLVGMGFIDPEEELTITKVRFYKGLRIPSSYWDLKQDDSLPLDTFDPIVLSEVITDLNLLAAKIRNEKSFQTGG